MGFKYIGDSNLLAYQFESGTYATASGAHHWIGLVQDHTPDEGAGVENIRFQGNHNRNIGLFTDGPLEYGGTFTFYPQDWTFLGFAVGSVHSVSGSEYNIVETNSDDQNYAVPTNSLSSITLVDSKKTHTAGSNFIRTFKGAMIDTLNITMSEGEIAACEVGYLAQSVDFGSGAVTTVTAVTEKPFMWSDISVHMPSGTKLTNCTEFSLSINNNLERRYPLNGSRTVEQIIPLNRDYEVSSTFIMDTDNAKQLYDEYFIGGSSFNVLVEMKASIGSLYMTMSGCRVTDMEVPSPVEGLHEQTATIMPTSFSAVAYGKYGKYTAW